MSRHPPEIEEPDTLADQSLRHDTFYFLLTTGVVAVSVVVFIGIFGGTSVNRLVFNPPWVGTLFPIAGMAAALYWFVLCYRVIYLPPAKLRKAARNLKVMVIASVVVVAVAVIVRTIIARIRGEV